MELYHASGEIVEFPEIRKENTGKTFHGDFIVLMIKNKPKDGLKEIERAKEDLDELLK